MLASLNAILGVWIGIAFVVWIGAELAIIIGKVKRFFADMRRESYDDTLDMMYERREGSGYMKSRHADPNRPHR